MCDDTWTADRRGMVKRCEFVPMDTRENGKCWTKSLLDTKEPKTCGVASSANASFVSPSETVRHFPPAGQLLAVEDTRIIRLPRDSICFEDHCYSRTAARIDLCIKCGLRLSGSGGEAPTPPDPPSLPSATTVQSRLLGMRDELFHRSGGGSAAHLRELVSLQAELILSQQEQLLQRSAQLSALGQDKALLESRIERLQRRVSLMQRTQTTPTSSPDVARRSRVRKPPSTPSRSTPTGDSPLSCTPKKRSPSPSASLAVQTPPLASTPRRSRHRRERGKGRRTGSSASHVTHHVTYVGEPCNAAEDEDQLYVFVPPAVLALPPYPGEGFVGENGDGEVPVADTEQQNGDVSTKVIEDGTILTPGWRVKPIPTLSRAALVAYQATEEVHDDAFLRRHRKHEEGERRRKRWDNQRQREELERENLLKRYRQVHEKNNVKKEGSDKKMASFNPPVLQVERIELSDRLPVSAFGCPVPKIKQSIFSLPWSIPESDGQS